MRTRKISLWKCLEDSQIRKQQEWNQRWDQGARGALDIFDTQEVVGEQMKMKKASPTKDFIS